MRPARRAPLSLLAAALLALMISAPASAHTQLVGVEPADGATVAAGDVITLTFSEELLQIGAEASVTDSTGASTALDVDLSTPREASVTLPTLASGSATLAWRVVAGDGHPVEGTLGYVVDGAAGSSSSGPTPDATAGASPDATAGATAGGTADAGADASAQPSATPAAEAGSNDGGNSGVQPAVWIAIGAALFAAIGGGAAARRGKRGPDAS